MNDATTAAPDVREFNNKKKGRLYAVRNIIDGSVRLVMAGNAPAASRHVAQDTLEVTIPTTVQAIDIQKANPSIEIEQA